MDFCIFIGKIENISIYFYILYLDAAKEKGRRMKKKIGEDRKEK